MKEPETTVDTVTTSFSDDLFESAELRKLQEQQDAENEPETDPDLEDEADLDTDTEEEEDQDVFTDDEADPEEEEEEPQPKTKKTDRMSYEQLKRSYENLEALVGRQGEELGKLRKQVTPDSAPQDAPKYTENDIPNLPDDVLDNMIKGYEGYLSTPNKSIEDADNYGQNVIVFNKLLVEQRLRQQDNKITAKSMATENENVAKSYNAKLALSPEELASVTQLALKISDTGRLTTADLDVALHKLHPGKFNVMFAEKERERIAKAKTTTRTIPPSTGSPNKGTVSINKVRNMDADELSTWLRTEATDAEIQELRRKKIIQ